MLARGRIRTFRRIDLQDWIKKSVFDGLWQYIATQLQHNQLFSGGLILMIGGALLAYCRQVPQQFYQLSQSLRRLGWTLRCSV